MNTTDAEAKKESWFKRLLRWLAIPRVSINYFHQREAIGIFLQEIGLASKLNLPLADTLDQVRQRDYPNIQNVFRFKLFIILSMFLLFGVYAFASSTFLGIEPPYQLVFFLIAIIAIILFLVSFSNFPRRGYVRYLSKVVSGDIKKGMPLSKAMESRRGVFEPFEIGMIRCGEEAGDLSGSCKKAAEFGQIQAHFARLGNYLIYPILLLVIAGLLIMLIIFTIMPKFEEIYAQLGADMPGLYIILMEWTQVFFDPGENPFLIICIYLIVIFFGLFLLSRISSSGLLTSIIIILVGMYVIGSIVEMITPGSVAFNIERTDIVGWLWAVLLLVVLFVWFLLLFMIFYKASCYLLRFFHNLPVLFLRAASRVPGFRKSFNLLFSARFLYGLGYLLSIKMPLHEAVEKASKAAGTGQYARFGRKASKMLSQGESFGKALQVTDIIPRSTAVALALSEKTGNLEQECFESGKMLMEEGRQNLKRVVKVLEPMVIICLEAMVGFVIIAMYSPLFAIAKIVK